MKVLALELSSARGSIALLADEKVEFSRGWPNDRKNSGPFFEHLSEVRKRFGKPDAIVVGLGPGSYAGTRIAISTAIGLSLGGRRAVSASPVYPPQAAPKATRAPTVQNLGHDGACSSIKLIGYPSICAIQCDAPEYCVIGDARRNSFFYARIADRNLSEGPALMTGAELREKLDKIDRTMSIFTTEKLPQFEDAQLRYPAAELLARLAADAKRKFAQPPLEPMYLREPHITIPKK